MKKTSTDLPRQVLAFAHRHGMLPAGSTVLCALSGGGDSMALLGCLLALSREQDWTILAAHYNHQLRGAPSDADEAFVADWCRQNNVPLTIGRGDVAGEAKGRGQGIEETARAMRYDFLEKVLRSQKADCIATAHNADDNGETLLLHLVRGTGLDGLAGIPPVRGHLVRPLLGSTRQEIEAYLAQQQIPHRTDQSNFDPAYARNRLRLEVMPVLRDLNPGFSSRLAANLEHIRADRAFLEDLAAQSLSPLPRAEGGWALPAGKLTALPRPLAVRAVKQTLARLGRHQISAVHLDQVLALAAGDHPSAQLDLPQGLLARKDYDTVVFLPKPAENRVREPLVLPGAGTFLWEGWNLTISSVICPENTPQGADQWHLRPDTVTFPLTLRTRRTGDSLRLPGRRQKPLKKWYIDEKIPRPLRDTLPVLTDRDGLIAAAGLGPEEGRIAQPGQPALRFTLKKIERT